MRRDLIKSTALGHRALLGATGGFVLAALSGDTTAYLSRDEQFNNSFR